MFRIDGYLKDSFADDKIVTWLAKQFSAEMAIGDTVFLWRAKGISCIPGIIAKGKVVSLPENQKKFVEDYWIRRKDFKEGLRARIELCDVRLSLGEGMLTKMLLLKQLGLEELTILHFFQQTNFPVTEVQAKIIERLWKEAIK